MVAGQPRESELYALLIEEDPHDRMPQKADALPSAEIALIKRWIAEGARFDGDSPERPLVELAREALLRPAPQIYSRPVPITALAFSPDGTQLAVAGYYEVTIWNLADGSLARRVGGLPERITALAWHPQRNVMAVAGGSAGQWGGVALVDPAAGFQVRYLCDLSESALSVAFNPAGDRLVMSGGDRLVRFFEVPSGKPLRVLRHHADWVQSVAFSPDGKRVISASRDRTARIVEAATGELDASYSGHEVAVLGAVFSTNEGTAISIARGQPVHGWDAKSGEGLKELAAPGYAVQRLAVLGPHALTGASDGLVRVHQLSDRQVLFTLHGHRDAAESLAVAPAGELFASGSYDGEVCIWSLACGTWVQRFLAVPQ